MRWLLVIGVGMMLAGCDGTINGIGQDMQKVGASLSNRSTPEPPPPPPYTPGYRDDDRYPSYQEPAPRPFHDPSQPYYLNPRN